MWHTWENAAHLEKYATHGKLHHTWKMRHTGKSAAQLETLGKVRHTRESAANLKKCGTLGKLTART